MRKTPITELSDLEFLLVIVILIGFGTLAIAFGLLSGPSI